MKRTPIKEENLQRNNPMLKDYDYILLFDHLRAKFLK